MGETQNERAARQAVLLFAIAGTLGLVNSFIPGMVGYGNGPLRVIDLLGLVVAAAGRVVPWHRVPARSNVVFVVPALALISASHYVGGVPAPIYGVWYLLTFFWVGLWHPPRTCLLVSPLAVVAYVWPFLLSPDPPAGALASVAITIPVGAVLGELLARTMAELRASQVAQAEATAMLAKASVTDDLTGIGNRRHGNRLLDSLVAGDAVAIIDLDHFKSINDRFGHSRGDTLLCDLGEYLAEVVRGDDDVARFGGDEFIVVLRAAGDAATATIDRLRSGWHARLPLATFSAGLAVHTAAAAPCDTFARADAALYEAKQRRDCVRRGQPARPADAV